MKVLGILATVAVGFAILWVVVSVWTWAMDQKEIADKEATKNECYRSIRNSEMYTKILAVVCEQLKRRITQAKNEPIAHENAERFFVRASKEAVTVYGGKQGSRHVSIDSEDSPYGYWNFRIHNASTVCSINFKNEGYADLEHKGNLELDPLEIFVDILTQDIESRLSLPATTYREWSNSGSFLMIWDLTECHPEGQELKTWY